ncbi:MAG TPA: hypothetical protein VMF87_04970 [Streptosporangiaceae bacterium]|nr:hypothetical protein [Streptosporangiaceae bacterium]
MRGNRLAAAGAALLAGALAVTGCASAAAKSAAGSAQVSHAVHVMVYSINSDGPDFRAVLDGAIADYGPAVTVYPDGKIDPSHSSDLQLNLTRGSFRLHIAGLTQRFVAATSHEPIYPRTCSDHLSVTAPVAVVAGSGTGAYQKISGRFTVTAALDEDETPPCPGPTAFRWQVITMSGSGFITP